MGVEGADPSVSLATRALPDGELYEGDLRDRISQSLQSLTARSRQVLELHYFEDLPLREISALLDLTPCAQPRRDLA